MRSEPCLPKKSVAANICWALLAHEKPGGHVASINSKPSI